VWGAQELQRELVRAMQLAGCVLIGATADDHSRDLVGFVWGFAGWSGGPHLHSHMLATLPDLQSRGVGFALKLAQRAAALDAGFDEVRWTYDPLLARNAWFNLMKLGASATAFLPEFYGRMTDLLNAGDRSDRFEVRWLLRSARAEDAAAGSPAPEPAGGVPLLEAAGDPARPAARPHRDPPDAGARDDRVDPAGLPGAASGRSRPGRAVAGCGRARVPGLLRRGPGGDGRLPRRHVPVRDGKVA
jgi:hypothetical protein